MKALMIGGTRFLGRYVVSDLAERGHAVTVMNRGTHPPHPNAADALVCDKADRDAFERILSKQDWDAVIDTILSDDDLAFAIEALSGHVGHFVHTGSIGVYAPCRRVPARESDPLSEHDAVFNFASSPKLVG